MHRGIARRHLTGTRVRRMADRDRSIAARPTVAVHRLTARRLPMVEAHRLIALRRRMVVADRIAEAEHLLTTVAGVGRLRRVAEVATAVVADDPLLRAAATVAIAN